MLQWTRDDAKVVEIIVSPMMRDHRLGKPCVEDLEGFVEAFTILLGPDTGLYQLLRHAAGATDLEPPARHVIKHPDLLQNPPRLVEGEHQPMVPRRSRLVERAMAAIRRLGDGL